MATRTARPSPTASALALRGAIGGVAAYALGYLVTHLWAGNDVRDALSGLNAALDVLGGEPVATWKVVGWLFFGAHGVSVTAPLPMGGTVSRNLLANADGSLSLLYLVPPVLLVAWGFVAARSADALDSLSAAATAGASVVVGYLPLAVLGVVVLSVSLGDVTAAPDLLPAVLLAGVAYPVVFGAAGGVLAREL